MTSSESSSPARKKIKVASDLSKAILEELLEQIYDTHETEAETDKELKKLEFESFEEKRSDEQLMDSKSSAKKLSDLNVEKVLKKQQKYDEEELARQADMARNLNILKAQGVPKRKRELSHKVKPAKSGQKLLQLPKGFRNIPAHLKKHFPRDHVLLQSKPDGTCGISCGAAHLFGQLSKGKQLRR